MKRIILSLSFLVFFFIFLSLSEFRLSRRQASLVSKQPSATIKILEFPDAIKTNTPINISWEINASVNGNTPSTSVYYDYESTPSAVTTKDSPPALGYHIHTSDYYQGTFPIPKVFTASFTPSGSGTLYFRAYAYVNGEHLWTQEHQIEIK